jgi:NAD(P)-dependent dehydrogenase (short-subunit alcohol dehydrogenase family)
LEQESADLGSLALRKHFLHHLWGGFLCFAQFDYSRCHSVVLVVAQARASLGQHTSKRGLADLKRIAPQVVAIQLDQVEIVAKAADMQRLFAETQKAFNRLDVLVNNAGVYKFLPLEEITEDEFHREFNINVTLCT